MKAPKVRLYVRVRHSDGRYSYLDPAWNRNRTLRAGYALVAGQPEHHPEGVYYLRFLQGSKRVWQSVGPQPDRAQAALRNTEHDLDSIALGRVAEPAPVSQLPPTSNHIPLAAPTPRPVAAPAANGSPSLNGAIESYLSEVRRFRSKKTIAACEHILRLFGSKCSKVAIQDIERNDLLDHMSVLRDQGLCPRTIYNHIARITTLLRSHKIIGLLARHDKPQYDEKVPDAYGSDQLLALLSAALPEERILFEFLLGTGFREQEVMYCTWKDIDFKGKVVTVRSKPAMGFRLKDKEERSVPIPDSLVKALAIRKAASTSMLLFPGPGGKPHGHFLRVLKNLALRSHLNCGECTNKAGKSCADCPVCSEWDLHKFRRTFATIHSEGGVSPRTIQHWLGHSDLSTTLRYLSVADLHSDRTRNQVNSSFAAFAGGGVA